TVGRSVAFTLGKETLKVRLTMAIPETVLILGTGTVVLAVLFGARLAMRAVGGEVTVLRPSADEGSAKSGSGAPDVAGVIALPPFILLGFLVAATLLETVVPLPILRAHAVVRYLAGSVLVICGLVLIGMGSRRFVAAGTNIPPNLPTTALVVDGVYARTRNPL